MIEASARLSIAGRRYVGVRTLTRTGSVVAGMAPVASFGARSCFDTFRMALTRNGTVERKVVAAGPLHGEPVVDIVSRRELIDRRPELRGNLLERFQRERHAAARIEIGNTGDIEVGGVAPQVGIDELSLIPGQHRHAGSKRLLVGDALRFVLAEKEQRAGRRERPPELLLGMRAVLQHRYRVAARHKALDQPVADRRYALLAVPAYFIVDEKVVGFGDLRQVPLRRVDAHWKRPQLVPAIRPIESAGPFARLDEDAHPVARGNAGGRLGKPQIAMAENDWVIAGHIGQHARVAAKTDRVMRSLGQRAEIIDPHVATDEPERPAQR